MSGPSRTWSLRDLNRATLARQGLLRRHRGSVADVVGRLAALQAQAAEPPYIALWSRREDQTIADLEAAIRDRTVVKATVMRSTLHLVAGEDYPAFDGATTDARQANWKATARRAGVDLKVLHEKLLVYCAEPRTVAEIDAWVRRAAPGLAALAPAGVRNTGFRAVSAGGGLVHVPPSGLWRSHEKPRYLAASKWLGKVKAVAADDALKTTVERYLTAYGPASVADIGRWLGQPRLPRLRAAVEGLGDRIVRCRADDGRDLIDLEGLPDPDGDDPAPPRFLSRWDSVLIGYDVRDRILPSSATSAVMKRNADVLATFLVDGFVAGLWTVDRKDDRAVLRLEPLAKIARSARPVLEEEADALVRFHEPDATHHELAWAD